MLTEPSDLVRLRDGVRRLREICLQPGVSAAAHRMEHGRDAQHASGTCRMDVPDDPRTVVDPECRVLGCTGLRVTDALVMPEVPTRI